MGARQSSGSAQMLCLVRRWRILVRTQPIVLGDVFDTDGPFLELLRTQEDIRPNTDTKDYTPNTALKNDAPVKKKRITWPKTADRYSPGRNMMKISTTSSKQHCNEQ